MSLWRKIEGQRNEKIIHCDIGVYSHYCRQITCVKKSYYVSVWKTNTLCRLYANPTLAKMGYCFIIDRTILICYCWIKLCICKDSYIFTMEIWKPFIPENGVGVPSNSTIISNHSQCISLLYGYISSVICYKTLIISAACNVIFDDLSFQHHSYQLCCSCYGFISWMVLQKLILPVMSQYN